MKYILIIADGCADNPVPELSGRTPLQAADKPNIDAMAKKGHVGSVLTVPRTQPPGSDTAILSIFGCDPNVCYTGRAPLEAAGAGVPIAEGDLLFRANVISLADDGVEDFNEKTILSHNAGSIEGERSKAIMSWLVENPEFKAEADRLGVTIYPAASFRHITVQKGGDITGMKITPPHDILTQKIGPHRHHGSKNAEELWGLMALAHRLLDHHPINEERRAEGKLPANGIWFWAEGTAGKLPNFVETYGKNGSVISAVPLVHGIGALTGLKMVSVEGATGETETNYEGKTQAAVDCLKSGDDFVCIHVEAPDEATHNGNLPEKILSIEYIDRRVVKPLLEKLGEAGFDHRILLLSDHKTLMSTRSHDGDPVPYIIYDSREDTGRGYDYCEASGEKGEYIDPGTKLMGLLFSK